MAQAARLSMRMHKEVKLLLSDPPHGASFPHLSSAAAGSGDLSTFSTIDAQIEGPEETVYANGTFNVKIQIPERYPFQPPFVAFATPIYHPNIDNSGRICLDILNLPPKGAWQPSLNISTVLLSIRLLLGEPNPDDGLMCDVSREYKYNRQSFDYKAREMTEMYAKVKNDGCSTSFQIKNHGDEKACGSGNSSIAGNDDGSKLKLTVDSSLTVANTLNRETAAKDLQEDRNGKRKAAIGFREATTSGNNGIKTSRKKLSQSQKKEFYGEELPNGVVSAACKENKKPNSNGKKLSLVVKQPCNDTSVSYQTSAATSYNNRQSRKLSLRPLGDLSEVSKTKVPSQTETELEMNQNEDARSWRGEFDNSVLEETAIVLDSDEEGEQETVSSRSRLSLARGRGLKRRL